MRMVYWLPLIPKPAKIATVGAGLGLGTLDESAVIVPSKGPFADLVAALCQGLQPRLSWLRSKVERHPRGSEACTHRDMYPVV